MSFVRTRTSTQSRSHAQKFLAKIKRKGLTLKEFLDGIDFQNLEKLSACEIGYDEDIDLVLRVGFDDEEAAEEEVSKSILQSKKVSRKGGNPASSEVDEFSTI